MVKKLVIVILLLPLLGVSCSREKLVDNTKEQWHSVRNRISRFLAETGENFVRNLSETDRKAIEEWLIKNKLNQYGDTKDTIYAGGTPLFNEQTGQSLNRYEYLFDKFPELKDIIKNATEKK